MARYNLVKIGDIFLTTDGLQTGRPCKVDVTGLARLRQERTGTIRLSTDGTPYLYTMLYLGKGLPLQLRTVAMQKSVLDNIIEEHNDALNANATLNLVITGTTGDFNLQVWPSLPDGVDYPGTFSGDRVYGVVFNYVIDSINPPEEPEP